MLPKVVVFNSISVDGAVKDFTVDVALHYEVLARISFDALLVGSATAKLGIELFVPTVPPETPADFESPKDPYKDAPLWIIPDSRGSLQGLLHVHRNSGYAKDIIVLVSKTTPKSYLDYLAAHHYDYIVTGDDHADLRVALEELNRKYGFRAIVTDTGGALAAALFEAGLVDEVQLLVTPEIVGMKAVNLFRNVKQSVKLEFVQSEQIKGHVLLTYKVKKA